nr:tryptophan synthase subunit alpha [Pelosinus sp. UFO1]
MMVNLEEKLQGLKASGKKGLIVYITAGYPDYASTLDAVLAMEKEGADVVEIGIPFSDPIADGPVIQKAATLALKAGATTIKSIQLIKEIRKQSAIPLVVMTYVNSIIGYGMEKFIAAFAEAGINGLIVPDLPIEESPLLENICHKEGVSLIQLIAPTSTTNRIHNISQKAQGFLYCVSNTGVTGVRNIDYSQIGSVIATARQATDIPMAIGFGIGSPEGAAAAAQYADAVIVGSAILEKLTTEGVTGVRTLVRSIRKRLDEESGYCEDSSKSK